MEQLITLFFATFSAAFMAAAPPGLLNVNAAKISVLHGKRNGVIFSMGIATTTMVQAYIGMLISKFLYNNPEVIDVLLRIAIVVFAFFAVYFFFKAKRNTTKSFNFETKSKRNYYFRGLGLASLNFLTIPYYSLLNTMWNASGWIKFELWDILVFIVSGSMGTFGVMYLYAVYFNKIEVKSNSAFAKNSNYILSVLMLILVVITIIRMYYR